MKIKKNADEERAMSALVASGVANRSPGIQAMSLGAALEWKLDPAAGKEKEGGEESSTVVSLSPVGTWKSADLSTRPVKEVNEIQPQVTVRNKHSKSPTFQDSAKPIVRPVSVRSNVSALPFVHSGPKSRSALLVPSLFSS